MKILFVSDLMDLPEAEMISRLCKIFNSGFVFCDSNSSYVDKLKQERINYTHLKIKNKFDLNAILILRKEMKLGKYDVVTVFTARALSTVLFASSFLKIKPIITAYRGTTVNVTRWDPLSWLTYLHPRVSKIHCVSNGVTEALLSNGVKKEKVVTIYKGHDFDWYRDLKTDYSFNFNKTESTIVFSCVANARPNKGIDILLQSFSKVLDHLPDSHLLLIGKMETSYFKQYISDQMETKVHFLGFRNDSVPIVGKTDVHVSASKSREGLSKSTIEAMLIGTTVIATNVSGANELIDDGKTGLVVEPVNIDALANAMIQLGKDPVARNRMAQNAKEKIIKKFHIDHTVVEMEQMYLQLVR